MRSDTRASVAVKPGDDLLPGVHPVLHPQPERQLSGWAAYGKVTTATRAPALAGPDATDAALADSGAGKPPQSSAPRSLCVLRHCRELLGTAAGPSGRGALLAQNAKQPELERRDLVEGIPSTQGAVSVAATKAISPPTGSYKLSLRCEATSDERSAGNPHATFCGSRGRVTAPGDPVEDGRPCPLCRLFSTAQAACSVSWQP